MKNKKTIWLGNYLFIIVIFFSTHFLEAQTCPTDMIHYWKLDEDFSPYTDLYGLNATCTICPTPVTGIVNKAQQFTSTTNLGAPSHTSFNWTGSFSIEFWMKTDPSSTCSGNQVIIGRDDPSNPVHWWVGCKDGGQAAFYLGDRTGTGIYMYGSKDITDGYWHHIVAMRNTVTNEISLYVDGQKEASGFQSFTDFNSIAEINIGWLNLGSGYHFIGILDEIAIYNNLLTEVDIKSHYYLSRNYCEMCISPVRIIPLGDSITYGYNDPNLSFDLIVGYRQALYLFLENSGYNIDFVGQFQNGQAAIPTFDPDHQGVIINGGFTAQDMANNVYSYLNDKPADVVLLHIGTNNVCNTTVSQIELILNEINRFDEKITVLLARIIGSLNETLNTCIANLNNAVESMVQTRKDKIILVDQEHALTYPDDMYDYLHPKSSGYEKMASKWFEYLQTFLPICMETQPHITSTPINSVLLGQNYTYDVNATGVPTPTYSLLIAPTGMTIDTNTGLIQWMPTNSGTYNVTVKASNNLGEDSQSFSITVYECPTDMIHYWKLDEDFSPYTDLYGLNATCTICPTPVTGIVNKAQQFTSTTNLGAPSHTSFNWTGSFSIEFWMKTDPSSTCSGNQVIIGRDDPSNPVHWWVGCKDGGQAAFYLGDRTGTGIYMYGSKDITDGYWHHIVAMRNTVTNEISLYVDGQKEASGFQSFTDFNSIAEINIGWLNLNPYFHFIGLIDEIAVYNKALTETDIQQHYSGHGYCSTIVTHTITATAGSGGSISPSGTVTVNHCSDQTFTIIPDSGYKIADVLIDGNSIGPIASYTFTNVTSDHTIEVRFSIIPTTGVLQGTIYEASFPNRVIKGARIDTTPPHTTYSDKNGFYQLLNIPSGIYDVTASAKRYTIYRINAISVPAGGIASQDFTLSCDVIFTDVSSDHWAINHIKSLYCMEITNGCSTNPLMYCPDKIVSRKALSIFFIRALEETPSPAPFNAYFDDIANDGFAPYINRLWELSITSGCGQRMFCPDIPVTRAQIAVLLIRAIGETPSSVAFNAYFDDIANDGFAPYINRLWELSITSGCGQRMFCPDIPVTRAQIAAFIIRAF